MEMAKSKKNNKNQNKNREVMHNKKVEVGDTAFTFGVSKIVKCFLVVLIVLALTYFLTIYITDKNMRDSIKVPDAHIQYEVILAGESFHQNREDYMVLYFDQAKFSDYSEVLSEYNEKEDRVFLYKCYTNEALNQKFVSTDAGSTPSKAEDLKVSENTLIRFKDHKVVEYITDKEEIISYLKSL